MLKSRVNTVIRLSAIATLCLMMSVGCSNLKKKSDSKKGQDGITLEGANEAGMSLELNGDSDSNKAGALKTVYFDFNSAVLRSDTKDTLKGNADFLKANATVEVQVEGHCDERGSVQYNIALGEKRAMAVKQYLTSLGVQGKRITTISFGKERPIAFGHDEGAWSQNRRGNFVVTAK